MLPNFSAPRLHGIVASHKSPLVILLLSITRISSGGHPHEVLTAQRINPKSDGAFYAFVPAANAQHCQNRLVKAQASGSSVLH